MAGARFSAASAAAGEDLLDLVLGAAASEAAEDLAPAIPRVFAAAIEKMRLDLRGWLRALAAAGDGFAPLHRELAFGLPADRSGGHDPASAAASVTIELGELPFPFHLRGSIDLVEARAAAGPDEQAELRVTDHKTGRPLEKKYLQIGGGEKLQPILYALTAEKLLGKKVGSGRLFFCTRRGGYKIFEVRLDGAARQAIAEVLGTLDNAVAEAFLPAWPRPDACATCDFVAICGPHEEKRIERKKGERLRPLELLRGRS